ncbi:MAG: prepilin-type N-terminal cleavage/methylation domain-containing protein [Candidatus Gastranaerophilaceae bacterium]
MSDKIVLSRYLLRLKRGFSLAEVLITLGIIGVVAAMTIPNLITEHQKKVTVTKLLHAISVLNQAYRVAYDDVGEINEQEAKSIGPKEYFNKYWAPYIKTAHICTNYSNCGYKTNTPFYFFNGKKAPLTLVHNTAGISFYTAEGFLYIIRVSAGNNNAANGAIIVDINGSHKPNKYGRDVFMLTRMVDGEKSGIVRPYYWNKSISEIDNNCTSSSNEYSGWSCAEKIHRAGWKIDKSYPWK